MEQVYMARTGGTVRSSLIAYRNGEKITLHYLVLGRTNPSKIERLKGIKCKRFKVLDNKITFNKIDDIRLNGIMDIKEFTERFVAEFYQLIFNGVNDAKDTEKPIKELTERFIDEYLSKNNNVNRECHI